MYKFSQFLSAPVTNEVLFGVLLFLIVVMVFIWHFFLTGQRLIWHWLDGYKTQMTQMQILQSQQGARLGSIHRDMSCMQNSVIRLLGEAGEKLPSPAELMTIDREEPAPPMKDDGWY